MSIQTKGVIDYHSLELLINSGIANCAFKILREEKSNNQLIFKSGTGFCFNLPDKGYKFFLTNNYILNQEFLDSEKKLILYDKNDNKIEIDLSINRFKMTDKDMDFTIIEILEEDNLSYFLEVDEFINSKDYKDEEIFTFDFPEGKNLQYSFGKCQGKYNNSFSYSSEIKGGSPLILKYNSKLIGLHKGTYGNSAVPINLIIDKLNFIKCVYNIDDTNIGKEIQIINKGYNNSSVENNYKMIIENQTKDIAFKYKFFNKGKYNIYFLPKDYYYWYTNLGSLFSECVYLEKINFSLFRPKDLSEIAYLFHGCSLLKEIRLSSSFDTSKVNHMSSLFNGCKSLEEINLSCFNTNNVTGMHMMFYGCSSLKKLTYLLLIRIK